MGFYREVKALIGNKRSLIIRIEHPKGIHNYLVGWINVTFKTATSQITLHVSEIFNPCFEIAYLFIGLLKGIIPNSVEIDEEGEIKVIQIFPYRDELVRFQIRDYDYGEKDPEDLNNPSTYIDVIIDKKELLCEFFNSFIKFLKNDFKQERWREINLKEYYLPLIKEIFLIF